MKDILELYDAIIDECPRFERKGKNMRYTSANGHMFSQVNKAGELGIRFSKERQEELFDQLNTTYFKSYGATMRGYVLIPVQVLSKKEIIAQLLNESYDYVMTLDPK